MMGRFSGTVLQYDKIRSFGFIKVDDKLIKDDAFIYFKDIEPTKEGFKKLQQGQTVEFDLHRTDKGLVAKNLSILSTPSYPYDDEGENNGNR
jgi:cold shock CspA family protein